MGIRSRYLHLKRWKLHAYVEVLYILKISYNSRVIGPLQSDSSGGYNVVMNVVFSNLVKRKKYTPV